MSQTGAESDKKDPTKSVNDAAPAVGINLQEVKNFVINGDVIIQSGEKGSIKHDGSRKKINAMKMAENGGTITTTEHGARNTLAVRDTSADTSAEGTASAITGARGERKEEPSTSDSQTYERKSEASRLDEEPNARNAYEQQIVEGVEEMKLPKPSAFAKLKKFVAGKGSNQKESANIVAGVEQMNLGRTESDDILTRRNIRQPPDRQQTDISAESSSPDPKVHEVRGMRIRFLREHSRALLGQSEYIEAAPILEEILSLEETANFDTRLLLAECYLHIGREIKANKAIQVVRDIVMTSQTFTADDIYKLGSELVENSSHIRGIILLRLASDLYETNASTPDDVVKGIASCIVETHHGTIPLIKAGGRSRIMGLDIGVENMIEMNQVVKAVKNAKPEHTVLKVALSNYCIVAILHMAKEYEKSIKFCQAGIEILEQYPLSAPKHKFYGLLLYNLGVAHFNLGKRSEAEPYFVKAIEAKEQATDFRDEIEKQKDIEDAKNHLKLLRVIVLLGK